MSTPQGPGFPGGPGAMPGGFAAPAGGLAAAPNEQAATADKKKSPPRSGRSSMRTVAIAGGVLALLFMAALLLLLGGSDGAQQFVVRAKQNLPAQQAVTESMIEAVPVDADVINPNWITGSTAREAMDIATGEHDGADDSYVVVGKRPVLPILAGQEIRREALADSLRSAAGEIAPNERVISIAVPAENAAGGALRVGDLIDVVVTDGTTALLVTPGVEIIGVQAAPSTLSSVSQRQGTAENREAAPEDLLPTDPMPGVYVLRVSGDAAVEIAAANTGDLHLVYRSPSSENVANNAVDLAELLARARQG